MRLKVEVFLLGQFKARKVVYVPGSVQTIRDLQRILVDKCYPSAPRACSVLLTLDGFTLDMTDPISTLVDDDVIRIDTVCSASAPLEPEDGFLPQELDCVAEPHPQGPCAIDNLQPTTLTSRLKRALCRSSSAENGSAGCIKKSCPERPCHATPDCLVPFHNRTKTTLHLSNDRLGDSVGDQGMREDVRSGENKKLELDTHTDSSGSQERPAVTQDVTNIRLPSHDSSKHPEETISREPPATVIDDISSSTTSSSSEYETDTTSSCSSDSEAENDATSSDERSTSSTSTAAQEVTVKTANGYTVGDKILYQAATLIGSTPSVTEQRSGEVSQIHIAKEENGEQEIALSIQRSDDATCVERFPLSNLINIVVLERHQRMASPQPAASLDVDDPAKGDPTPRTTTPLPSDGDPVTFSACASYTRNHPVLGSVEVPTSLTEQQVDKLLTTKLNAVRGAVRRQVDFYFSDKNYYHDKFLRSQEDSDGWIPLRLVASFNRIKNFTSNLEFISTIIANLSNVEVSKCKTKLRKRDLHSSSRNGSRNSVSAATAASPPEQQAEAPDAVPGAETCTDQNQACRSGLSRRYIPQRQRRSVGH